MISGRSPGNLTARWIKNSSPWRSRPASGSTIPRVPSRRRTAGAHLAVATSKSHPAALRVMTHFGLADAFDVVCGSAPDGPATKAGVIRRVLQQLGCPQPGRAVMIGDRKYDILGARAVGLSSVGVLYGYGSREELCAAGADALAASVSDLQALLLQNLSRS